MQKVGTEILLASQPIYDRQQNLYGCELLFRSDQQLTAKEVGDDRATSEVLVNYCTSVVEQSDIIQRPVFINISETLLLSEAFFPIHPEKVVLELLETITITPDVIRAVKAWKHEGFRFALDDYEFRPEWEALLPLASYIKVDVLNADPAHLCRKRAEYSGTPALWVAERVETAEAFQAYLDGGFDLFQGYFLARPKTVLGKSIKSDHSSALDIVQAVNDPDIKVEALADVISRDPRLAMQLLKIVNSPACSLNREVQSIRETIVYLGIAQVRKWAIILSLLAASGSGMQVCRLILIRAKTMENYAEATGKLDSAAAFMVGLLSGVDLLLEIEPAVFLQQIKLSAQITGAVINHSGPLGKLLHYVTELEHVLMMNPEQLQQQSALLLTTYAQATAWAENTLHAMHH